MAAVLGTRVSASLRDTASMDRGGSMEIDIEIEVGIEGDRDREF